MTLTVWAVKRLIVMVVDCGSGLFKVPSRHLPEGTEENYKKNISHIADFMDEKRTQNFPKAKQKFISLNGDIRWLSLEVIKKFRDKIHRSSTAIPCRRRGSLGNAQVRCFTLLRNSHSVEASRRMNELSPSHGLSHVDRNLYARLEISVSLSTQLIRKTECETWSR
jgi:hypothetical protein